MQASELSGLAETAAASNKVCCWEEAHGGGRILRCYRLAVDDRPWCSEHCQRFYAGKLRRYWLAPRGRG
jgi:hypothetical protein